MPPVAEGRKDMIANLLCSRSRTIDLELWAKGPGLQRRHLLHTIRRRRVVIAQLHKRGSLDHAKRLRALRRVCGLPTARNRWPIIIARHQLFLVHIVLNISGDMAMYAACRVERAPKREDVHQAQSIISMSQDKSTDHRIGGSMLVSSMCRADYGP